jgi:hypothetical protein
VPTVPFDILDCTIYLYASREAAEKGEQAGGSGFLVSVPLPGYPAVTVYAVTNSHVIAGGFTTVRLNTADGRHDSIALDDHDWSRHPEGDDLAISQIDFSPDFRFKSISCDSLVDGHDSTFFGVGQEVVMVGRYINHEGRQQNRPTARFGNIAQLPYERVRTAQGIEQDAFLVDIRSLAGYSGSPVFVYRGRPDLDTEPDRWIKSFEHRLVGIDFGHLPTLGAVLQENRRDRAQPPTWAEQNSGMAAVIPAWRLLQMLFDDDDIVDHREEGERRWLEEHRQESEPEAKTPPRGA